MFSNVRPRAITGDAGREFDPAGIVWAAAGADTAITVAAALALTVVFRNPLRESSIACPVWL
jgi:hypothetical protein